MFSKKRINFWLDISLFILWVGTALTGLLLYFLPNGRGGAELMFLAQRTLRGIHPWTGLALLVGSVTHLTLHRQWLVCVARRFWRKTSLQARLSFSLASLLFLAFTGASLSGLTVWLMGSAGGYRGGRDPLYTIVLFGLTRPEWRDFHRWAELLMFIIVAVHLILHWRWITCALRTYKMGGYNGSVGGVSGGKSSAMRAKP